MIKHRVENGVTHLGLANPPLNVITIAMLRELAGRISDASRSKVLVIRGEGGVFSAGVDVGEHLDPHAAEMIGSFRSVFEAITAFDGIAVAGVDGLALGGGCELACLCDVIVASERSEFGQPETRVGVLPPVASVLWPRAMGYHRAFDLIVSGRRASASEMADMGIVARLVPVGEFDETIEGLVNEYRGMSRTVVAHAKRACRVGAGEIGAALRQVESLYLNSLMKTDDAREGLQAFLDKRNPKWKDK